MKIPLISTTQNRLQKQQKDNTSFNGWVRLSDTSLALSEHFFKIKGVVHPREREIVFRFNDESDPIALEVLAAIKAQWPSMKAEGVLQGKYFNIK